MHDFLRSEDLIVELDRAATRGNSAFHVGNDHLVGADQAEIPPDQLVGKIGIDSGRIQKLDMVGQSRPLSPEPIELDQLSRLEVAIIAPAPQAVGPEQGVSKEVGHDQ